MLVASAGSRQDALYHTPLISGQVGEEAPRVGDLPAERSEVR